jgi:hypothetical protein
MKAVIAPLALLALSACATGPAPVGKLSDREAKDLAKALDGKVAGTPVSCVSTNKGENLRAIGDRTLIYRVSSKLVYRNDLIGACTGLRFGDTLVMEVFGSRYCRGDMARSVNLYSGAQTGSCALGDFVPYTAPNAP